MNNNIRKMKSYKQNIILDKNRETNSSVELPFLKFLTSECRKLDLA